VPVRRAGVRHNRAQANGHTHKHMHTRNYTQYTHTIHTHNKHTHTYTWRLAQVGKMIELLGSKASVSTGKKVYGTAFGEPSNLAHRVEDISEMLVDQGFSYSGKDFLTSGITGVCVSLLACVHVCMYTGLNHAQGKSEVCYSSKHTRNGL